MTMSLDTDHYASFGIRLSHCFCSSIMRTSTASGPGTWFSGLEPGASFYLSEKTYVLTDTVGLPAVWLKRILH
jgi:hypothetical protein